jgi:hypothetical protein
LVWTLQGRFDKIFDGGLKMTDKQKETIDRARWEIHNLLLQHDIWGHLHVGHNMAHMDEYERECARIRADDLQALEQELIELIR